METRKVNEEFEDANFQIELLVDKEWKYITNEFSISEATQVMVNLYNATNKHSRVLSNRSGNKILAEI